MVLSKQKKLGKLWCRYKTIIISLCRYTTMMNKFIFRKCEGYLNIMTKMSQKSKLIIINECYNDISSIVVRCYPAYLKASNCGSAVPRDKSPAGGKKKEKKGVKKMV